MPHLVLQASTDGFYIFADDAIQFGAGLPGLAITVSLSKSGGTFNTVAPTITDLGGGVYWIAPLAAHRDTLGEIAWQFAADGAVIAPRFERVTAVNDQLAAWGANTVAPDNDGIAAAQLAAETAAGLLVGRPPTVVLPSSVSVPDRRDIASVPLYLDETIVVAISIFELDEVTPVNLTDEQLEVVVEDGSGAVLVVIEPEQITIGGYNSNVVTFAAPAPVTDRVRLAPFAIRRKGGDQCVFANGQFDVRKAPRRPPSAG